MKQLYSLPGLMIILLFPVITKAQNTFPATGSAGIGTVTPDASSVLDMQSTTKGILIPRMTRMQRDAILSPASGLMVYQTNSTPGFYFFDGSAWKQVAPAGVNKSLSNLTSPTAVNVDLVPGNDATSLGSPNIFWRTLYLNTLQFKDGTTQTSAFNPYTAGPGISIVGNLVANSGDTNATDDANLSLANLAATSINQSLIPGSDNSKDLGSSSGSWKDLYLKGDLYFSGNKAISFGGIDNTIVGIASSNPSAGTSNSFFGKNAGQSTTLGSYNAFFGKSAGFTNTTGSYLSFFGKDAGYSNSTGNDNAFFGTEAGYLNSTGYSNSFFGSGAGYANTGGYSNSFFGYNTGASNSTGNGNSFFGANAGPQNNTGGGNSFFGSSVGHANTSGYGNSFFGQAAGYFNTTGYWNSFFGENAGSANTLGYGNCFFGINAGSANTSGNANIFLGKDAGLNSTTGIGNVFIGNMAGKTALTGGSNTCIGSLTNIGASNLSNSTAIGSGAVTTASNQVRIGSSSVSSIGGYQDWTNISDGRYKKDIKENVPGLDFINKLRPVTYHLDITGLRKFLKEDVDEKDLSAEERNKIETRVKAKEKILNTGFVAQDVEKAAQEIGYDFNGVDKPQNESSLYGLRYSEFVVPLVKAVQELSKENDELKSQNEAQQNINKDLESKYEAQQKEIDALKTMITKSVIGDQLSVANATLSTVSIQPATLLSQNVPNPFNHTTTINYSLPEKFTTAQLVITDNTGKTIKSINISGSGKGTLTIDASALTSGTYHYSLYVNGKLVDSKSMQLMK